MIKADSKVTIIMANNYLFGKCTIDAKLLSMPQGAGDCFHFELSDGKHLILNGNSTDFVGIMEAVPVPGKE